MAFILVYGGEHFAFDIVVGWHSPTFDEPVYVSSGLAALRTGELSLNDEHPPLAKVLAVLPVLLAHPVIPVDHRAGSNDEQIYSAAFLQAQIRAGTLRAVDFASRIVPLLESVALALLLGVMVVPAGEIGHGRRRAALAGLTFVLTALASIWLVYIALNPGTKLPISNGATYQPWCLGAEVRTNPIRSLRTFAGPAATPAWSPAIVAAGRCSREG